MKDKILLGLMLILLCATVSADWYFQEVGNQYGEDGTWDNAALINDSNWSSGSGIGAVASNYYVNYSLDPDLDYQILQVHHDLGASKDYTLNFTLSTWVCQSNPIQIRGNIGTSRRVRWYCRNATAWIEIYNDLKLVNPKLYEEGLFGVVNYTAAVDNCSTHTHKALNFSLFDANGTSITGSLGGHIELDEGQKFNLTWKDAGYFEVCLKRDWMTPTFDGQFEYSATGYDTEVHYISGSILNNDTTNILLQLNKDNETSTVSFTVSDENDNPVENVLINVMEYDLATDSAISTEIVKTNSNGVANANVILYTQRYKFILMIGPQVYLETSDLYLTGLSYGFRINLGDNFYDSFAVVQGVSCLTTFDNSTGTFEFVWSDPTARTSTGCLEVTKTIPLGMTAVYDGCITSYGGSISHNVSASAGNVSYVGQGSIYLNGQKYLCGDSASFSYDTTYKKYGLMGAFATFLIILVVVLAGLWHPGVAVGLGAVVIMLSVWMKFIYLGWGTLAGVLIIALLTIYRLNK